MKLLMLINSHSGLRNSKAKLLDVIEAENFDHRTTAKRCGITPSGLLKKLYRDPELWQFFQFRRKELALSPLLPPR